MDEMKNVRRIQSVTRTSLENELKTKMLGYEATDGSLGFKDSTGTMHWYTQEGADAFYNSLQLEFNGAAGMLAVDANGNVILTNSNSSGSAAMSTGVVSFTGITINTDTTKFDVGNVQAYFVDNTNPETPIVTFKDFPATTANIVTNLATQNATYIAIDVNGVIHQSSTQFTQTEYRDWIPLGTVVHSNRTVINTINNNPHTVLNPTNQLEDFMHAVGDFVIDGNVISPNGSNLKINKTGGSILKHGANFVNNSKDPHILSLAGLTAPNTIRYRTQDGDEFSNTDTIDAGQYDLNGSRTTITGGTGWTNQRVYLFSSNLIRIQYGQTVYTSKIEAMTAIGIENFVVESNIKENGIFIAYITVEKNANNLSNIAQAIITTVGKFGTIIGNGTSSIDTLQSAYDNSTTPEILTNIALGPVSIKRGYEDDDYTVLELLDNAGDIKTTFDVLGNIKSLATGVQQVSAKMGRDPQYDPYAYFGANGSTRHGLTIGVDGIMQLQANYTGGVVNPESYYLALSHKMAADKYVGITMAENGKMLFASNTDSVNMLKTATYSFIGDVAVGTNIVGHDANIRFTPSTGIDVDTRLSYTKNGLQWTNEYHGVEVPRYTYDFASRTYTLTTGFVVWKNGVRYTLADITGYPFVQHPSFSGITYVYLNTNLQLETAQTPWTIDTTVVPLFAVYTNPTNAIMIPFYENHSYKRNTIWHSHAHTTLGTQAQVDGFALTGIYPKDVTPSDARLKYAVSVGWIKDEDIKCTLDAMTTPGTGNDAYPVMFRTTGSTISYTTNAFPYYHIPSNYITYNNVAGGSLVQCASNKYVNYFIIAIPRKTLEDGAFIANAVSTSEICRHMWVAGQAQHDNEASADTEEWTSLNLGDLSNFPEFVPIYKVTYKTLSSYTTSGKCIVWSYKRLTLSRATATAGVASTLHNSLTGRDSIGAHPITAITGTATQVFFADASGNGLGSSNFVWDNVNSRLGIGGTPSYSPLDVFSDGSDTAPIALRDTRTNDINVGPALSFVGKTASNATTELGQIQVLRENASTNAAAYMAFKVRDASSVSGAEVERMRLDSTGRLGLGTAPTNELDILGSGNAIISHIRNTKSTSSESAVTGFLMGNNVSNSRAGLYLYGLGQPTAGDVYADGVLLWSSGAGGITIATEAAQSIRFFTGSPTTEKMRIAFDGKVTFGGTSFPTATGSAGQVLTADGSGSATWAEKSGPYTFFTGTWTGMSVATTASIYYEKMGNIVTLFMTTTTGTSNLTTFTITGIPAALRPVATRIAPIIIITNAGVDHPCKVSIGTTGTMTFSIGYISGAAMAFNSSGFASSGIKGTLAQSITYNI